VEAGKTETLPFLTKYWTEKLAGKFIKAAEGNEIK
jgi:hypothetical protein